MKSKLLISLVFSLIMSAYSFVVHAQTTNQTPNVIVQGTVSSVKDGPLIGVCISEVDANNRVVGGTITDLNGYYVLRMKNRSNKINYTYTGYISQTRRTDSSKKIDVVLAENTQQLKEVMIVSSKRTSENGFSIPKREISTAIQSLDMKEIEGVQVSSVDEALQGRIAGLDIVANSGDAGSGSTMRIRGASSINGSSTPLIVLNDVPYEMQVDNNFDFANSNQEQFANLLSINPDDIQEITVLKDAAASAIWGSKGANGVISIRTKKGYSGPTKIEYSYRFTGTVQPRGLKMLNGDDYTMLMKQAYFNVAQDPTAGNYNEYNYNTAFTEYENSVSMNYHSCLIFCVVT